MKMHAKSYVIGISSKALNLSLSLSHGQMDGWMDESGWRHRGGNRCRRSLLAQARLVPFQADEGRKEGERTSERKKGRKGLIEHAAFYRQ